MGTLSALKIVFTDSATSAPMPSPDQVSKQCLLKGRSIFSRAPGMRVVVYFPPYFVGLKISDWTVAIAAYVRQLSIQTTSRTSSIHLDRIGDAVHRAEALAARRRGWR